MPESAARSVAFSGLPLPFLEAVRGLFDLMDADKKGWITLNDVSPSWEDSAPEGGSPHLPRDILGSLRKVVGGDGRITFERFCAGLKIAILRHEAERNRVRPVQTKSDAGEGIAAEQGSPPPRVAGGCDVPSGAPMNRTSSLPNMVDGSSPLSAFVPREDRATAAPSPAPSEPCNSTFVGPPKPPRDPLRMSGIFFRQANDDGVQLPDNAAQAYSESRPTRRTVKRRDSQHRRHTVQGGIDLNMVKQMRQFEEERAVVEEGLLLATKTHEWYLDRLSRVQEKMQSRSHQVFQPSSSEANQERLVFELQSIRELNQRLGSLSVSGKQGGFPTHYDLQVQQKQERLVERGEDEEDGGRQADVRIVTLEKQVERLKAQNKLLTEEVGKKSNVITNLEQEKSLLIKQLFQARSAATSLGPSRPGSAMGMPFSRHHHHHHTRFGHSQADDESTLM